jgi:hypothetical protein
VIPLPNSHRFPDATAKIHNFSHSPPGPIALPFNAVFAGSSGFGELPFLSPHSAQLHRDCRGALLNGCLSSSPADGASGNNPPSTSTPFAFPFTTMNSKSASPPPVSTTGTPKRRRKTQSDERPPALTSPTSPTATDGSGAVGGAPGVGAGAGTGAGTGSGNNNNSSSGATSSFRNVSACNRCRLRKNRCDQRLPACQSCEKAVRRLAQAVSSAVIAICLCPTLRFPGPCCFKLNAEFFFARAYDV